MHTENGLFLPSFCDAYPGNANGAQRYSRRPACRILVVDDDDLVRSRLFALLSASDYAVEVACSGTDAVRVLDTTHCHVVLTDWQMPDMDGLALCRHVRLRALESYIYVVMLTVRHTSDDMLMGFAAGADDYLVKGTPVGEILARLEIGRRISRHPTTSAAAKSENRELPHTDSVSGAHSIVYLAQHLPRELARSQRYGHAMSVLNCEIDGLGEVINQFGYAVGDALLRAFVTSTGSCIRNGDWLARTGAREFMLVLPETSAKGAHRVAEKLRQQFALHPLATPAGPIAFTSTIAVTAIDAKHDADSILQVHALLCAADRRMVAYKQRDPKVETSNQPDRAMGSGTAYGGQNELN